MKWFFSILSLLILCHCSSPEHDRKLLSLIPPSRSGIEFVNTVINTKELNIFNYRNFYNGGGVGIGDINNDGLADIFLTGNTSENQLYLNKGGMKFENITTKALINRKAKWSTGVVMVDINSDGWLDIYVCNAGYMAGDNQENELYINNQDLTFTEKAAEYGLNSNGYSTHAAFFDMDLDGDLDAYILNNSFIPVNTLNLSDRRDLKANDWPVKDFLKKGGDQLLRNDKGIFTDVTHEAGIYNSLIGFGLGITVGDVNADDWPDIYVSNDFYERDYLYINNKDGTFTDEIQQRTDHISLSSMGADLADLNNDRHPEIFVTDMLPDDDYRLRSTSSFESYSVYTIKQKRNFHHQYMQNTLQFNRGDGSFAEIAHLAGVSASDWSWGALLFDMDLDGFKDIYISNGIQHDVTDQDFIDFFADEIIQKMALTGRKEEFENVLSKMPSNPIVNKIFRNKGDLKFEDVSAQWAEPLPSFSNGASYGDLDNDGDLDLVVNNVNEKAFLFENRQRENSKNHFISLKLKSSSGNTFAIGSKINVYVENQIINADIMPSRGFQSSVDYKTILGLGKISRIDSIEILWPGFKRSLMKNLPVDTLLVITDDNASAYSPLSAHNSARALLIQIPNEFQRHVEDEFVDFYSEGLLMHKLSREGPAYARGDINGDHIDDIIIGGAAGQETMVYLGNGQGWYQVNNTGLEREVEFEDVAAILHDLDGDGDNDLVIGSGGNHDLLKSRLMQDRIYLNQGNGTFVLSPDALPPNGFNTSSIAVDDIDLDGAPDLIICSRSIPGNYGPPPRSYVYRNNGKGSFSDATEDVAPDIAFAGMITDVLVANIMDDDRPEWIITREWGSPLILSFSNNQYRKITTDLDNLNGWWFCVIANDLDQDGDLDLVLGNRGENFYYSGISSDHYKLWVYDFDQNITVENIVTRSIGGKDVPVNLKKELTEQLPFLKKENLKHKDFAKASIQDLIPPEKLNKAFVLHSDFHSSVVAWNNGEGKFEIERLPVESQLSCITTVASYDVDGDNNPDLLMGGNNFGMIPQFSRLDAHRGLVLLNKGRNNWKPMDPQDSGWSVKGELKALDIFPVGSSTAMLCLVNNEKPSTYFFRNKAEEE